MPEIPENSLESFFEKIDDHRRHNKLHKLTDVILIAICAVAAGTDTYEQTENFW